MPVALLIGTLALPPGGVSSMASSRGDRISAGTRWPTS